MGDAEPNKPGRPAVTGDLAVLRTVDLLQWLEHRKIDGLVRLRSADGRIEKRFVVRGEAIVGSTSNDPREFLGQFLVNFAYLSEEQLQEAFAQQKETRSVLGKVLTLGGLCTEDQVKRALTHKLRESLFDTLVWKGGTFDVFHGQLGNELLGKLPVSLDLADLRPDAELRLERWQQINEVFPTVQLRCELKRDRIPPSIWSMEEHAELRTLLEALEQGSTVEDLLLARHSTRFPLLDWLYDLYLQDFLKPVVEQHAPPPETPSPVNAQHVHDILAQLSSGDFHGAADALASTSTRGTMDPRTLDLLRRAEDGVTNALRIQYMAENKVPKVVVQVDEDMRSELTAHERYLVERIDGQWGLKDLIRVSPIGEADALRVVRNLERRDIIRFGKGKQAQGGAG